MRRRILLKKNNVNPYQKQYLTFTAVSACQVKFTGTTPSGGTLNQLQYSLNNGTTWNSLANDTYVSLSTGDTIMFRGECEPTSNVHEEGIGIFSATGGTFSASGNVMSLLFGDDFADKTSLSGKTYAFTELFSKCTNLVSITDLILPATTLVGDCYRDMFNGCTGLTTIPTGLLPATTLAVYCYYAMFQGCTSLTTIPSDLLPATTLAIYCYNSMFQGCTSLTTIPSDLLPATTLETNCYSYMFYGCTNITTAPDLPATTLAYACYGYMFYNCTNLSYIKCLATDISARNCTTNWVYGVNPLGSVGTATFVKAIGMDDWDVSNSGIPTPKDDSLCNFRREWAVYNNEQYYYLDNYVQDLPENRGDVTEIQVLNSNGNPATDLTLKKMNFTVEYGGCDSGDPTISYNPSTGKIFCENNTGGCTGGGGSAYYLNITLTSATYGDINFMIEYKAHYIGPC